MIHRQPSTIINHLSSKKALAPRSFSEVGYSLLEILITISILILLLAALFFVFNPKTQIDKANDGKRKTEMTQLTKILEDWYNDKQCYPKPSDICYNAATVLADGTYTCNICGTAQPARSLSPYLRSLPCDPVHPQKKYLYQFDSTDCPTWYRIYSVLSLSSDPAITAIGCSDGCGPPPSYSYNYGVSSPNIGLESRIVELCSSYPALYINPDCNICGNYEQCKVSHPSSIYYTDPATCQNACIKD